MHCAARPPVSLALQADVEDMTPFKALDQAQLFKRVRFAPEFLSAATPCSAPRHRMMAPCSDVCHPTKFRSSNLQSLTSEVVPVDDGPIPVTDVEYQDLFFPPSDGVTLATELAPVIDPNLMPSPIARILKKYFLGASKLEEPSTAISVGSPDLAKEKSQSMNKPCKPK